MTPGKVVLKPVTLRPSVLKFIESIVRHHSEEVEYLVENHGDMLGERLAALG